MFISELREEEEALSITCYNKCYLRLDRTGADSLHIHSKCKLFSFSGRTELVIQKTLFLIHSAGGRSFLLLHRCLMSQTTGRAEGHDVRVSEK